MMRESNLKPASTKPLLSALLFGALLFSPMTAGQSAAGETGAVGDDGEDGTRSEWSGAHGTEGDSGEEGEAGGDATSVAITWFLKPFITPLFTRMTKENAMDHPNRRKLYDAIQADPGIGFREVARRAGLAAGTARHHLNVLCRHGLVQEERHRFTQRFFPASIRLDPVVVARGVLLREPQLARLHAVVEANAWITQSDLIDLMAREVGWTRSTTQHRLARLVSGGLVQVRQQGRFQLHAVAGTVHPQDAGRLSPSPQPLASQYAIRPKPSTV